LRQNSRARPCHLSPAPTSAATCLQPSEATSLFSKLPERDPLAEFRAFQPAVGQHPFDDVAHLVMTRQFGGHEHCDRLSPPGDHDSLTIGNPSEKIREVRLRFERTDHMLFVPHLTPRFYATSLFN
jgi:hypothetical protein